MAKSYSGYTAKTAESLILGAGAFFVNYDVVNDTFDTAVAAGKLLGATRGGGSFSAVPEMRKIEIDGVSGAAKGLSVIDSWEVKIMANVLEITQEGLAKALTSSVTDKVSNPVYDIIRANNHIDLSDYIDNITYVGKKSGSIEPIVIQIYNAINTTGLTLATADKDEAVIEMEFEGHYDADDLDNPPFALFYPKVVNDTLPPTVTVSPADGESSVAVTSSIVWTFNEKIKTGDVTGANFFVTDSLGLEVVGTLSLDAGKTTVTFKPNSNLGATQTHTAIATKNVRDVAGNALVKNEVTNFTTV